MKVYCNARKRDGVERPTLKPGDDWAGEGYCKATAGRGTDHPGKGRCKHHGGATPVKHGRYSVVEREDVREMAEHFENDDDPLDVLPELAQMRALLTRYVNRYAEIADALLAWNAEEREEKGKNARPQPIPDLEDAIFFLEKVSKIAQKEKKLQSDTAVSRPDFMRVLTEMGNVVEAHVEDEAVRERIRKDWLSIKLA